MRILRSLVLQKLNQLEADEQEDLQVITFTKVIGFRNYPYIGMK